MIDFNMPKWAGSTIWPSLIPTVMSLASLPSVSFSRLRLVWQSSWDCIFAFIRRGPPGWMISRRYGVPCWRWRMLGLLLRVRHPFLLFHHVDNITYTDIVCARNKMGSRSRCEVFPWSECGHVQQGTYIPILTYINNLNKWLMMYVDPIRRWPRLHPCITRIQSLPAVIVPAHRGLRAGLSSDDHRGYCGGDVQPVGVYFLAVVCL